jgi:hypothetical protein
MSAILHRAAFTPGTFNGHQEFAACGLRRDKDVTFTSISSRVTCPGCRGKMEEQRAAAKDRLAEIEGR